MTAMVSGAPRIFRVVDSIVKSRGELQAQFLLLYDDERIIVDLTGIDLLDVDFLAELAQLRVYRRAKRLLVGRLIVDSQPLRTALSAVGFERDWAIFRTLDEALLSFDAAPLYL